MADKKTQIQNLRYQFKTLEAQFENAVMQAGSQTSGNKVIYIGMQLMDMGVKMLDLGAGMPKMGFDSYEAKSKLQNVGIHLKRIESTMDSFDEQKAYEMPNPVPISPPPPIRVDSYQPKPMSIISHKEAPIIYNREKIDVKFSTTNGKVMVMHIDPVMPVSSMLNKFIEEYSLEFMKGRRLPQNKFVFLLNNMRLYFEDRRPVESLGENLYIKVIYNEYTPGY